MIHYTLKGKETGEPLLLIHGFPSDQHAFDNIIEQLAEHFKLILVDLPGAGKSINELPENLSMNDMADAVMAVVDFLKIDKVHFSGHSMGGYTCANIGDRYADRISSITFIHSGTTPDDATKIKLRQKSIALMQKGAKEQRVFLKALYNNFFDPEFTKKNQPLIDEYVNKGMQLPNSHLAAFYTAIMLRKDTQAILPTAQYPICWVAGVNDTAVIYKNILKESCLPKIAKLVSFENCGHCAMEEMPNELAAEMINFINDCTIFEANI